MAVEENSTGEIRSDVVEEVAQIIARARNLMQPAALLPKRLHPTWDEVWPIERRVEEIRDLKIVGWKIGAASDEIRVLEGIPEPLLGSLHEGNIYRGYTELGAEKFINYRACEPEFVFELGRDLELLDRDYEPDDLSQVVENVYAGLEVGDLVFGDWDGCTEFWGTCIDNAGGSLLVIGEGRPYVRGESLADSEVSIFSNGELFRTGTGKVAMGDPLFSATWAANKLRRDGVQLRAGDFISTGTCTGHLFVGSGYEVRADFQGVGSTSLKFL